MDLLLLLLHLIAYNLSSHENTEKKTVAWKSNIQLRNVTTKVDPPLPHPAITKLGRQGQINVCKSEAGGQPLGPILQPLRYFRCRSNWSQILSGTYNTVFWKKRCACLITLFLPVLEAEAFKIDTRSNSYIFVVFLESTINNSQHLCEIAFLFSKCNFLF